MKNLISLGIAYCLANITYADLVMNTDGNALKMNLNGKQIFNVQVPEIAAKNIPQLNIPIPLPKPIPTTTPLIHQSPVTVQFTIEHQVPLDAKANRLEYPPFIFPHQLIIQNDNDEDSSSSYYDSSSTFYDSFSDLSSSSSQQTPLKEQIEEIGKTLIKQIRSTVNQLVQKKHQAEEKLKK